MRAYYFIWILLDGRFASLQPGVAVFFGIWEFELDDVQPNVHSKIIVDSLLNNFQLTSVTLAMLLM